MSSTRVPAMKPGDGDKARLPCAVIANCQRRSSQSCVYPTCFVSQAQGFLLFRGCGKARSRP